jgi:hypothetical protein
MDANPPTSLSDLKPRYYHPAMIDAAHLSIKAIIIIVVLLIIVLLLGSCWCWCCCRRRRKRAKKRAQKWCKKPQPNKQSKFKLPSWTSRTRKKGRSNDLRSGAFSSNAPAAEEMELPRYSSSSSNLGKMTNMDFQDIVVPKKVYKKSWRSGRKLTYAEEG